MFVGQHARQDIYVDMVSNRVVLSFARTGLGWNCGKQRRVGLFVKLITLRVVLVYMHKPS